MERHRELALVALRLVDQDRWPDADLAAAFGSQLAAAEATGYLAGFLLQLLAVQRGEDVRDTERFVRHLLEGGDDGFASVREPPRPLPPSGSAGREVDLRDPAS